MVKDQFKQLYHFKDLTRIIFWDKINNRKVLHSFWESIQGKGIAPDIVIEQGEFESFDFKRYSESDLDSLDKEDNNSKNKEEDNNELSEKEERLARDYQLRRALDLIRGLSLFEESLQE